MKPCWKLSSAARSKSGSFYSFTPGERAISVKELAGLYARAGKVRSQIGELESGKGLTTLGKEILLSKEESEKQRVQLVELNSQLNEISVKIEELKIKMKARKFVFSGEVYLRQ